MNFLQIKKQHVDTQGYGRLYDRLDIGTKAVSDAAWERGWNFTGTDSLKRMYKDSLLKSFEQKTMNGNALSGQEVNHLIDLDESQELTEFSVLSELDARAQIKDAGLEQHLEIDGPISNIRLSNLIRRKHEAMENNWILNQAEGTNFLRGMGIEMFAAVVDPLNIPLMFSAAFTKPAWFIDRLKSSSRLSANVQLATYTGVAASAVLEVPIATQANQDQLDYTAVNSVINIAFGGIFSGALGTLGHATGMDARVIGNIVAPRDRAGVIRNLPYRGGLGDSNEVVKAKLNKAALDIQNGEPVDVGPIDELAGLHISKTDIDHAHRTYDDVLALDVRINKANANFNKKQTPTDKQIEAHAKKIDELENKKAQLLASAPKNYKQLSSIIRAFSEHENVVISNQPNKFTKTVDGKEKTFNIDDLTGEEKKLALKNEKIKQDKIKVSEDRLTDLFRRLGKDDAEIDEIINMFDMEHQFMATDGMKARGRTKSDYRAKKGEMMREKIINLANNTGDDFVGPRLVDQDSAEFKSTHKKEDKGLDEETENSIAILTDMMGEDKANELVENVKNINDTFEVTMGSKEVNDVLRRIMKCKEIL